MRVRTERPPWYLSVVGGTLFVSAIIFIVCLILIILFAKCVPYDSYYAMFRKHLLVVQRWFQIISVILRRDKSHPRYGCKT